ncbi:ABC transporter permease [Marivirga sp.]|uniref:ABC transporter permease n=1 Tax=Marivirga sp. TaxID=2018662 RepID=UPI0025EB1DD2|nr:ABC transporter permease [Marivirga sp.]
MIKNYFKIAFRNIKNNKSYSFINVLGLGLSLACGISIFSIISYHFSFDNFHSDSDRIYRFVTEQHRDQISYRSSVPNPFGKAFREDYAFSEHVARICTFQDQVISISNEERTTKFKENEIAFVEEEFFEIFNYPLLNEYEKVNISSPNTAILTENAAKKYFGDENPINKVFSVDNRLDFKVVGVLQNLPENTERTTQIFLSYNSLREYNPWFASDDSWGGISSNMQCFVKLNPGVKPEKVEEVLPLYVQKFRPNSSNVHHYKLQPLNDIHFSKLYGGTIEERTIWILAIIGLFLIITACVNFINLATAQASERSKEVGVRKVLGSNQKQLFWQFILETAVLTITATILALLVYKLAFPFINSELSLGLNEMELFSWDMMLFVVAVVVAVTFLAGTYPGLILAGFKPVEALKSSMTFQFGKGLNLRRALIITQFTISQALIIGLIIVLYQMKYIKESDLGFDKEAVIMIPVGSNDQKMRSLKTRFSAIPSVDKISLCYTAPASPSFWNTSLTFESRLEEEAFPVNFKGGDNDYLSTFNLNLIAGRNLQQSDTVKEFLVNETLLKKLNIESKEDIIGKNISAGGVFEGKVVGVVQDFHDGSFHEAINAVVISTNAERYSNYAVKINLADLKNTLADLNRLWSETYPEQIYEYAFLDEQIEDLYASEESMLKLIQLFSFIAIFLGCMGLYGMVSFMAKQKTKEIGISKVLGGSVFQMFGIFGKEFMSLVVIAFFIAAPISWWMMNNWLENFQYRIAINIWIFIIALLSTILIALTTVGYQSVKAALMNPVDSLKRE